MAAAFHGQGISLDSFECVSAFVRRLRRGPRPIVIVGASEAVGVPWVWQCDYWTVGE